MSEPGSVVPEPQSHFPLTSSQPRIKEALQARVKYPKQNPKQKQFINSLTEYIVKGMHPLCAVEEPGFIKLIECLDCKVTVPSRKQLTSKLIPELYDETQQRVISDLAAAKYVSVTFDMWTSRATDQYLGLTAHTVSPNWEFVSFVLENIELPPPHHAEAVAEAVSALLIKWKLSEKVDVIVSDNGSNCVKAIELMHRQFMPCIGHTLNLVIHAGVKAGMDRVIARCCKLAEYFHRSAIAKYCLEQKQQLLGLPEHKLILRCETRWNSIYAMLQRIIEQQLPIAAALTDLGKKDLMPEVEIKNLQDLVEILRTFKDATEDFSSQSTVTLSCLLPTLVQLKKTLVPCDDDTAVIRDIRAAMLDNLDKRYTNVGIANVLSIATFLDPRLKSMPFMNTERIQAVRKLVTDAITIALSEPLRPDSDGGGTSESDSHQPTPTGSSGETTAAGPLVRDGSSDDLQRNLGG